MRASGTLGWTFESWGDLAAFVEKLQPAPVAEPLPPPEPVYDAADNSKRSFDVAIEALHDRLESCKVELAPGVVLYNEDCTFILPTLKNLHACITDPPYHLTSSAGSSKGFMGKEWDGGDIAFRPETWKLAQDALLPGAHLIAFAGTRTYHRIACAIDDAGFEIRDCTAWLYGSGFPKSLDVSKAIYKEAGVEREIVGFDAQKAKQQTRAVGTNSYGDYQGNAGQITAPATEAAAQWSGWGTALKPSFEPACLARKRLDKKTVAQNVLAHGTGTLNVDACRIATTDNRARMNNARVGGSSYVVQKEAKFIDPGGDGRWPANLCHDGSPEVLALFPSSSSSIRVSEDKDAPGATFSLGRKGTTPRGHSDSGSAARFFYCAKVSPKERGDSKHPTMKPIALMEWLCKLVTPPGGTIVDPFMGSGTTGIAAVRNGFGFIGIEKDPESFATAVKRIKAALTDAKDD